MTMRMAVQASTQRFFRIALALFAVSMVAAGTANAGTAEDVFESWSSVFSGGTWTTIVDSQPHEHSYRKVLGGRFLEIETKDGSRSSKVVLGIDPRTKKCTFWQFDNQGGVTRIHLTEMGDNSWLLEGTGSGPDGKSRYKSKVTLIDRNHTQEEMIEHIVNGESQPKQTRHWTRKP